MDLDRGAATANPPGLSTNRSQADNMSVEIENLNTIIIEKKFKNESDLFSNESETTINEMCGGKVELPRSPGAC